MSKGVLLVNLGSPDSFAVRDVRRYLREFLMDERVIDTSFLSRFLVVNAFILPFRPRQTAEAYAKIWWPEGSPLIVISRRVQAELQRRVSVPVELAMRYQNPSIETGLRRVLDRDVDDLLLVPLYPHYAMSSYETVVVKVRETLLRLAPATALTVQPPFYSDPRYVDALVAAAADPLGGGYDHLLFSFHGVPERHLRKSDPTGFHCLASERCCVTPGPAQATCYRAHCFATVEAFVRHAGIPREKYSVAFQSRLGRDPWLKPYTDHELVRLASTGIRKLAVMCPSFVADCLETLEEIGLRGKESFLAAGGQQLTFIPCLNEHPRWLAALEAMVTDFVEGPARAGA
ncbi:MAG: ferrochelatase [Verrucomicrobia bacterium]|nr:ferrochelatase [Verrucomicrobiota bacterium]